MSHSSVGIFSVFLGKQKKKEYSTITPYITTHMTKTYLSQKILLSLMLFVCVVSHVSTYASQIGTGTVVGSGAMSTPILWNDTFVWSSASGTINGVTVLARILPTLNMTISGTGILNLGNITSTAASSGSVSIEIGTNAVNGASVTARSQNGGMVNISSTGNILNSLSADGFADSYRFISTVGTTDSTAPWFTQSGALNTEITNTTSQTLYTSTRPQPLSGVDDMAFTVSVQPNAQSPAGDYQDTILITVTGNF